MKGCELCNGVARMYCESDQASLCWSCDEEVHGANFLVAKHCRNLLCQVCQKATQWKASGPKLGPTVSICDSCYSSHNKLVNDENNREETLGGNEHSLDDYDDSSDEDVFDSDEEFSNDDEEEDEDGENQVVPWTCASSSSPSPPVASSSSGEEEEITSRFVDSSGLTKRLRTYIDSDDEVGCSSSQVGGNSREIVTRPMKQKRRIEEFVEGEDDDQIESRRSTAIIDSLKRFQNEEMVRENASATILGIRRLSRDHHSR